jgi:hypothetical protein
VMNTFSFCKGTNGKISFIAPLFLKRTKVLGQKQNGPKMRNRGSTIEGNF